MVIAVGSALKTFTDRTDGFSHTRPRPSAVQDTRWRLSPIPFCEKQAIVEGLEIWQHVHTGQGHPLDVQATASMLPSATLARTDQFKYHHPERRPNGSEFRRFAVEGPFQ